MVNASEIVDAASLKSWIRSTLGQNTEDEMTQVKGVHLSSLFLMLDDGDAEIMEKAGGRFPPSALRAAANKASEHAADTSTIDTDKYKTTMNHPLIMRSYRLSNSFCRDRCFVCRRR